MNITVRNIEKLIAHRGTFTNNSVYLARPYLLKNLEYIKKTYNRSAVSKKLDNLTTSTAILAAIRKLVSYAGYKVNTVKRTMKNGEYTYHYKILY